MISDATLGKVFLITCCVFFIYYTAWVMFLPFADNIQAIRSFPPIWIALLVPAVIGLVFIGALVIYTAHAIRRK